MNPADSATRGVDKDDMTDHMWWKGPKFILDPIEQWPKTYRLFKIPDDVENDSCALPVSSARRTHIMELLDWKRHNEINPIITSCIRPKIRQTTYGKKRITTPVQSSGKHSRTTSHDNGFLYHCERKANGSTSSCAQSPSSSLKRGSSESA
ncbi:hypothetical protein RB195_010884 [Necator americanus]|uniref:Uncharacterized protein n=1 Tax=Necator americanus TaxID=51031 RepID=A0ABR1CZW7_NECAM